MTSWARFYLGIHEIGWMKDLGVPVMVSRRRLARYLPSRVGSPWVLDSGGFTELSQFGRWTIGAEEYAAEVFRISERLPGMEWCAPQDWMCEPWIVEKTGLSVREHQARTLENFLELRRFGVPCIPVLQGFSLEDYHRHADDYLAEGVDLGGIVGLGSVCRRQASDEVAAIVGELAGRGLRLHGFGCKTQALRKVGHLLHSADSMAWSYDGRRQGPCTHIRSRCANHRHYALEWLARLDSHPQQLAMVL